MVKVKELGKIADTPQSCKSSDHTQAIPLAGLSLLYRDSDAKVVAISMGFSRASQSRKNGPATTTATTITTTTPNVSLVPLMRMSLGQA